MWKAQADFRHIILTVLAFIANPHPAHSVSVVNIRLTNGSSHAHVIRAIAVIPHVNQSSRWRRREEKKNDTNAYR
eukprot:1036825-Karenia_brevis.AAC.1